MGAMGAAPVQRVKRSRTRRIVGTASGAVGGTRSAPAAVATAQERARTKLRPSIQAAIGATPSYQRVLPRVSNPKPTGPIRRAMRAVAAMTVVAVAGEPKRPTEGIPAEAPKSSRSTNLG